jgi:hypothetical protein
MDDFMDPYSAGGYSRTHELPLSHTLTHFTSSLLTPHSATFLHICVTHSLGTPLITLDCTSLHFCALSDAVSE